LLGIIIFAIIIVIIFSIIKRIKDEAEHKKYVDTIKSKRMQGFSCTNCCFVENYNRTNGVQTLDNLRYALNHCGINKTFRNLYGICNSHVYSNTENKYQYWK